MWLISVAVVVGQLLGLVCRSPGPETLVFQLSMLLTTVVYCKKMKSSRKEEKHSATMKEEKHAAAVKEDDAESAYENVQLATCDSSDRRPVFGGEELVKAEEKKNLPVEAVVGPRTKRTKKSDASKIMKTLEVKSAESSKGSKEMAGVPPAHVSSRSCVQPMPPPPLAGGPPEKRTSSNSDERPTSQYLTY